DHRGQCSSLSGVLVRLRVASPSTDLIQMSSLTSAERPPQENATNRPSGDSDGSSSDPGSDVTAIGRGGRPPSIRDFTNHVAAAIRTTAAAAAIGCRGMMRFARDGKVRSVEAAPTFESVRGEASGSETDEGWGSVRTVVRKTGV